ncbi:MAG: hypothetical protein IPO63_03265 [Bacteroidetes bacterium]|nr:hypothetical protein [Bacteroidota bacterium]
MKNLIICFCILYLFSNPCQGQRDSVRNSLSTNLVSGIIFQEAGLYYNIKLSSTSLLELSYAHRFRNLTIIKNGGSGSEFKLWKQTGDIVRIGFKAYHEPNYAYSNYSPYFYSRISYWNLHTPKYTTRRGSNGYNSTFREVVSADKNLINLALGLGKSEQVDEHFFTDFFLVVGASIGMKSTHKYTYDSSGNGTTYSYPKNTRVETLTILPTIELGVNVGYFW